MRAAAKWLGAILGWGFLAMWAVGVGTLVYVWARDTVDWRAVVVALALLAALIGMAIVGSSKGDADFRAPYDEGDDGV